MSDNERPEAPGWVQDFVDAIESAPAVEASKAVFRRAFETATTRPIPGLPKGQLSCVVMDDVAARLDADFLKHMGNREGIRKAIGCEYREVSKFWDTSAKVAHIVSKHLGEEAKDIACALFLRGGMEDDQKHYPLKPGETKRILQWILGEKRFARYHKRFGYDYEKMLKTVWAVAGRSADVRWKICQALRRWQMTPEKLFMASAVRQGWQHMLTAREVTEPEWWELVERYVEKEIRRSERDTHCAMTTQLLKGSVQLAESLQQKKEAKENLKALQHLQWKARRYLAKHPKRPEGRLLVDMLECDEWVKALAERADLCDEAGFATLEKSIAHACHLVLMGYGDVLAKDTTADQERYGTPSYIRGLPREVVATKRASCLGSNWLLASLMLRSGIRPQAIRYVHANQLACGPIVPHALLLLITSDETMLVDRYDAAGREIIDGTVGPIGEYWDFIDGKACQANLWTDPAISASVRLPQSMVGARLFDGIAAEHMMHTGLQFFHEGQLDEAERAFLLAHAFCPLIPDILHHLGQTASHKGDNDAAKRYFEEAIRLFESDIASHFALGEIARIHGDREEAQSRFTRVADETNKVWGDDFFITKAKEYLKEYPKEPKKEEYAPMYYI